MQVHIFQQDQEISATAPLQINKKDVIFFVDPIKDTSKFLSSPDGKQWQLRFFIGSAFEQTLVVRFNGMQEPGNYPVGRACWLDNDSKAENDVALVAGASRFLRQSETLTLAQRKELSSNRHLLADRDGVAYFSNDLDQFKRIVLCQSLAIAYMRVISDCMARMTKSVQANLTDEALVLYENILRFNAAHYFSLPVQLERHELFAAWQVLCNHYHLKVLNQELTQQLSDVAALLDAQRERQRSAEERKQKQAWANRKARQDKADGRRTFLLSLAGVLLTATSLLSLFQLTPTQFSDNVSAWKQSLWKSAPDKKVEAETEPKPELARGKAKGRH